MHRPKHNTYTNPPPIMTHPNAKEVAERAGVHHRTALRFIDGTTERPDEAQAILAHAVALNTAKFTALDLLREAHQHGACGELETACQNAFGYEREYTLTDMLHACAELAPHAHTASLRVVDGAPEFSLLTKRGLIECYYDDAHFRTTFVLAINGEEFLGDCDDLKQVLVLWKRRKF